MNDYNNRIKEQCKAKLSGRYEYTDEVMPSDKDYNITILCREHGEFKQRLRKHLNGSGCPKCNKAIAGSFDLSKWKDAVSNLYEGKYDYTHVTVTKSRDPIELTCNIHGKFTTTPYAHLRMRACTPCKTYDCNAITPEHREYLNQLLAEKYGDNLLIPTDYEYTKPKLTIVCKVHGPFQKSITRLTRGGCQKCGVKVRAIKKKMSPSDILQRCKSMHGDEFNYDKLDFSLNIHAKQTITCRIHEDFRQSLSSHYHSGSGCIKCVKGSGLLTPAYFYHSPHRKTARSMFYLVRFDTDTYGTFYKIGVTTRTIKKRFAGKSNSEKFVGILELPMNLYDSFMLERQIKTGILKDVAPAIPADALGWRGGFSETFESDKIATEIIKLATEYISKLKGL